MTLTLRIENYDQLEDGGPAWITLDGHGASVGRKRGMDWVLPDPARHISGHHFDIGFSEGGYWLTDVSTNGTFVQGESHRLEGPRRLNGGERLIVGHYVIAVDLSAGLAPQMPGGMQAGGQMGGFGAESPGADNDPWDFGSGAALPPVNPLPSAAADPRHFDDVAQNFVPLQRPAPHMPQDYGAGVQQPPSTPPSLPIQEPQPIAPPPSPAAFQAPPPQMQPQQPMQPPVPQPVVVGQPPQQPAPPVGSAGADADAILKAFCEGAGLDPAMAGGRDAVELARDLGRVARASTEEIMRMLQDRANVKQFTRGGERTMRSATGNNPLKFLADSNQALEALFLRPRDGFMTGPDGFDNALKDLRMHQVAVFAALQPALAKLLEGMSPDELEEEAQAGASRLGGSRRGRNWDLFVERWDEKAGAGDHGMLDTFLAAFAKAYMEANSRGDGV